MELKIELKALLALNTFVVPGNEPYFACGINFSVIRDRLVMSAINGISMLRIEDREPLKETFAPFSLNLQGFLEKRKPSRRFRDWVTIIPGEETASVFVNDEVSVLVPKRESFSSEVDSLVESLQTKMQTKPNGNENQFYMPLKDYQRFFLGGLFGKSCIPLFRRFQNTGYITYPEFQENDHSFIMFGIHAHRLPPESYEIVQGRNTREMDQ